MLKQGSALRRYPVFRTADYAKARDSLEGVLGPFQLTIDGCGQPDIQLRSFRLRSVLLSYLSFGASVHLTLSEARPRYLILLPLVGRAELHGRQEHGPIEPGVGAVLDPDEATGMRWSADCGQLIVGLEKSALEVHTRSLLRARLTEPLRFEPTFDSTSGVTGDWYTALQSLVDLADSSEGILSHPLVVADMERALLTGLLVAQPNTYSRLLNEEANEEALSPTEAIILLIDMYPEWDHSVSRLAHAAGVSVRTLENEFHRLIGLPPIAYIRRVRLERVREDLMATTGREIRVSEVATRWGFNHFGRFSRDYYKEYNEKPSETVRRNRPGFNLARFQSSQDLI
jgi:AraC-like DNA-binding protein